MIDRLFALVCIATISEMTHFIGGYFGSLFAASAVAAVIAALYVCLNISHVLSLLGNGLFIAWSMLLFVWPFSSALLTGTSLDLRRAGLQFFSYTLFVSAIIIYRKRGWPFIQKMMLASLYITFTGVLLSVAVPEVFSGVARARDLYGDTISVQGRAYGFFLQPNKAANGILLITMFALAGYYKKRIVLQLLPILLGIGAIALTGSRGGAIAYAAFVVLYFVYKNKHEKRYFSKIYNSQFLSRSVLPLVLALFVLSLVLAGYSEYQKRTGITERSLADRFASLVKNSDDLQTGLSEDSSVRARFIVKQDAVNLIIAKPILGHGFDAMQKYKLGGQLIASTHDTYLKFMLEYGIVYLLIYLGLFAWLLFNPIANQLHAQWGSNLTTQFVCSLLLAFLVINTVDTSRTYNFVLGALIAVYIYRDLNSPVETI